MGTNYTLPDDQLEVVGAPEPGRSCPKYTSSIAETPSRTIRMSGQYFSVMCLTPLTPWNVLHGPGSRLLPR